MLTGWNRAPVGSRRRMPPGQAVRGVVPPTPQVCADMHVLVHRDATDGLLKC